MKKSISFSELALVLVFALAAFATFASAGTDPPAATTKLVFAHHSCGGNWLADPTDWDDRHGGLALSLMNNNFYVSATNYGWGPDDIGDRTDIYNWPEWFTGDNAATFLTALYSETGQNVGGFGDWSRLASDPGGENEIVMFKSCFPNSHMEGNPGDAPYGSPNDWEISVANAKAVYNDILAYFATRTDKLFVAVTAPPLVSYDTDEAHAANARAFNNWLVHDWLDGYAHDNVCVFDYFNVLTDPSNHHRVVSGAVQHVIGGGDNYAYYPTEDSHPNKQGQQKATQEFVPLLNYCYNEWKGGGASVSAPTVETDEATGVNAAGATMNGSVNPNGASTAYWFKYGKTESYGSTTAQKDAGSGTSATDVFETVGGLDPETVYHFRLTATNSQGTTDGADRTFTTLSATHVPGNIDASPDGLVDLNDAETALKVLAGRTGFAVDVEAEIDGDDRVGQAEGANALRQAASSSSGGELVHSTDFAYLGAFRLPDEFCWGARGMSFYPEGNGGSGSLFIAASEALRTPEGEVCYTGLENCAAYFGEVAIPVPAKEAEWTSLPQASFLRTPAVFDGGLAATVSSDYAFLAGIEYMPRQGAQTSAKLYGSLTHWYAEGEYGDDSFPTVWFSNLDGSNAKGVFHVGPQSDPLYHGRKMGTFMFRVPQWYADQYLGGRTLVTGRSRGTPAGENGELTTAGGSQGPTLFAFRPLQSDDPAVADLDALPMLYYRVKYPGCAGPDVGVGGAPTNCDYPGFSMCDEWDGGAFVSASGKNAVVLLGRKGSTNCYYCDETGSDPDCHVSPPIDECQRYCGEDRGYHCGPYQRQLIFYDPEELGSAAQGTADPWQILPYEVWNPSDFYLVGENVCGSIGGVAYDSSGGMLFMIERGLGGYQGDNAAVVHVWSVQ